MPARGVGKRFWQRVHALFAPLESLCSEVLHHAAYFLGRCGGRQWLSKRDAHRVGNAPRKFPKEAPAGKTENRAPHAVEIHRDDGHVDALDKDRKSTRLNSSHPSISYAVFCLKKKK